MDFEWDENKRFSNIRKHSIDFINVVAIFENDTIIIEDERSNYGEQRFILIGLLEGRVIVVVYTERKDKIRIISARKATKNEERSYFEQLPH
ncbi:hypothetical protein C7H19_01710 [Aphanothece hegewaldii CCALA 016]|uniref:BrnT family toxin n=1 Tax=Aphanothece hegewaldii CCALA 016 TaxID=2107694 RepID=A0A2T1M3Y8_9CHRO|nr:BrnT family toxin [Aphanothece hegewaldii]PSF39532.1 hypothetical protein C7H19_01710 [Aphanothece hegewaldii CCALA 016]